MTAPKFKPGQTVTVTPTVAGNAPRGRFKVVRALPAEHGVNQYRIQSVLDGHERVVKEIEIA